MCTLRPPSWNSGTWQFLVMLLPSKIWFKPLEGTLTCYTATTIPRLTYIPFCLFYLQFCTVIWNSTNGFVTHHPPSSPKFSKKIGIYYSIHRLLLPIASLYQIICDECNESKSQSRGELELETGIWNTCGNLASLSLNCRSPTHYSCPLDQQQSFWGHVSSHKVLEGWES